MFAEPGVMLDNLHCERAAIDLALEALDARLRVAQCSEDARRAEERMPGRDEFMTRITSHIVELMRAVRELRAYDATPAPVRTCFLALSGRS